MRQGWVRRVAGKGEGDGGQEAGRSDIPGARRTGCVSGRERVSNASSAVRLWGLKTDPRPGRLEIGDLG